MDYLSAIFSELFREWMPRGKCFGWNPLIFALFILGESMIVTAYAMIPIVLIKQVRKHGDAIRAVNGKGMISAYWWSAGFIGSCMLGHAINIVMLWHGFYMLSSTWSCITGVVSLMAARAISKAHIYSVDLWSAPPLDAYIKEAAIRVADAASAVAVHIKKRERANGYRT